MSTATPTLIDQRARPLVRLADSWRGDHAIHLEEVIKQ